MNALVNQTFNAPASGVFAGVDAGEDLSGGITGGYGMIRYRGKVWAIHFRQQEIQLMRDDGDGPKGSIDVVILKANPHLSKTWYENGWDETSTNPPDCASANGITPDAGVPKPQNPTCLNCPRNQWGTAPNGGKGKACGDHRRLAVAPLSDIANEAFGGPMLLRCPAASLQDLSAFDQKYKQAGYPYFALGVKISFDPKESYPKFIFEALRPLTDDEARLVVALRAGADVARVISESTAQIAPAAAAPAQVTFSQAPAGAPVSQVVAAQPVSPQPVQQSQPAPAAVAQPAPVAQPAASQPVARPHAQHPAQHPQTVATGFGAAAPAGQQPAGQPVAKAPVQMTGFGAAAPVTQQGNGATPPVQPTVPHPEVAAAPVQAAPVQAAPPQADPATQNAFDASLDEKLAALLG